ncbi:hypothetical protein M5D96_005866 [Drosophila gunungcola]|uniref:Uncharacterized protein n=1 Tax=Drosophila gunungcola TaxID=103775 RepID=A0A9Q0BRK9_9MUSC|nr:hypothetical protein M5D96_005866 [Drosophila gunungcola]
MCQSCEKIPASSWAKFYSIWCILTGTFGVGYAMYFIIDITNYINMLMNLVSYTTTSMDSEKYKNVLLFAWVDVSFIMIFSILYILAGVSMLLGMRINSKMLFKFGKVLSYFFAIYTWLFIITTVVHCVCAVKLCRYVRETWPKR